MAQRIYVVEDEVDIAELIRYNLQLQGYQVQTFSSGEDGLRAVSLDPPDLLVLDLMLPGMSGLNICREIKGRKETQALPIIMVTAKGEEEDIIRGLESGADDYVTKPFSPKILLTRIRAVLRRSLYQVDKDSSADEYQLGPLSIHEGRHEVKMNGQALDLTRSEFQILSFLGRRPGWVFTRSQIVDAIRGENYSVTERAIDFQMVGLRKKLGDVGNYIETVRGVGYRFKDMEDQESE